MQGFTRGERPLGVVVIGLFMLADAAATAVQLLFETDVTTSLTSLLEISDLMPILMAALAVLRVIAAVGLWSGVRPAWVLTMLIVGFGLVFNFYVLWIGDPNYPRLIIDVVIAFYLNQGVVRRFFEDERDVTAEEGREG